MEKRELTAEEKYNKLVAIIRRSYEDNKLVYNIANGKIGRDSDITIAKKGALMAVQAIMEEAGIGRTKSKFYFTFGSAEKFPYKRGQYIVVMADSYKEAAGKFKTKYPNPDGGDVLNCADYYNAREWAAYVEKDYIGKEPEEIIL